MAARRHASFLVATLIGSILMLAPAAAAEDHQGDLRGGLSAYARGDGSIDPTIESRLNRGTREIAVSVELAAAAESSIRARLQAAGLTTRGAWQNAIEGYIDPALLGRLARVDGVRSIEPIRRPIESSFLGPAPALHGATPWQQLGVRGTGVKVGIIDGGFDGFAGLLGTELPATVEARCYAQIGTASSSLADCVTPGEKHGTAVAESIIDMAAGASLYVSNARSRADLAATIRWMTAAGVRVINFSQGIVGEGMGDGTSPYSNSIYTLVNLAVAGGALFVAAAGNSGELTWTGPATDADANGWIDFAPGVERDSLDLAAGASILVGVRWVSTASDYDLSIWQGDTKVAESADRQAATFDPVELVEFTAPSAGTYRIGISHRAGAAAPALRLMVLTSERAALTYRTTAGSLPAPADSRNPGLLTVGAVDYRSPGTVEPYSSQGPTLDGRTKPDLVAGDCAPTVSLPEFCGTSESAPFASGAAALLLEADPTLTPIQLATYLRTHAAPIGGTGSNNATGFGLLSLGPVTLPVPAALTFLAPAASGIAGAPVAGQPVVGIVDADGHLVAKGPGAALPVTLSLATNGGGGTLACPAGLGTTATGGIARFTGCAIDLAGSGYALRADAPGLTGVVGAPFGVSASGTPPTLALSASTGVVAYGGAVGFSAQASLPAGANVTLGQESGTGGIYTQLGTSTADAAGLASWTTTPRVSGEYRIKLVDPTTGVVDVSAPVHVLVNATATQASSIPAGRTISRTTKITFTTTIRPAGEAVARGRARFDLWQRTSSGWARRRTVYANADAAGRARVTLTLPAAGSWWIRSRAEPTATNGASGWTAGTRYTVKR